MCTHALSFLICQSDGLQIIKLMDASFSILSPDELANTTVFEKLIYFIVQIKGDLLVKNFLQQKFLPG